MESKPSAVGVKGRHKERFKGNGNFLGRREEEGFEQIGMEEERA